MLRLVFGMGLCVSTVHADAAATFKQKVHDLEVKYQPLYGSFVREALAEMDHCKTAAETKAVFDKYCTGTKSINNIGQPWKKETEDAYAALRRAEPNSWPQLDPILNQFLASWETANRNAMGQISGRQREIDAKLLADALATVKFAAALTKVLDNKIEVVTQVNGPIFVSQLTLSVGGTNVTFTPDVAQPAGALGSKVKQRWTSSSASLKKGTHTGTATFGSAKGTPGSKDAKFQIQL